VKGRRHDQTTHDFRLPAGPRGAAKQEGEFLDDFAAGIDLGVYSKYVWRGINLVDDFVFQPALDLSAHGFGVNVWGNLDLTDVNGDQWRFSEWDLTAVYSFSLEPVEFVVGAAAYFFPTTTGDTIELFLRVGVDTILSPALILYQDVDEVDGTYLALSIGHTFEDPFRAGEEAGLSPEITATIGYGSSKHNEAYYGDRDSGFTDLTLDLMLPYRLSKVTTVAASLHYSSLLTSGIRDRFDDADNFWFGLSASFSF